MLGYSDYCSCDCCGSEFWMLVVGGRCCEELGVSIVCARGSCSRSLVRSVSIVGILG